MIEGLSVIHIVQLLIVFAGVLGTYYKLKAKTDEQQKEIEGFKQKSNKINEMNLAIEKLKTSEQYQEQIIEKIIQPTLDKMNDKMMEYIDVKVGVVNKEIENIKCENLHFKSEIKDILKEFKDDNKDNFELLIKTLKKGDS